MPKTYNDLYLATRTALKSAGVEAYALEARLLVAYAVGKTKEEFVRDLRLYTSDENEQKIAALLQRRIAGEPLAYLIGEWEFHGLPIVVTPDVLIPRMDTEVLVDAALRVLVGRKMNARILDLCSGSGCIGCALAHELPAARVVMVDISEEALAVSKENLRRNHQNRTICLKADALEKPPMGIGTFDLIVSNPPYVASMDILTLDSSVRDYEPLGALDLKLRKEMQQELKYIQQEVGITFIFVTHDQEEALTMSDKIVVMNAGEIQQIGTPTEIYRTPVNEFVAKFIGETNIIDGVMLEDDLVMFEDKKYACRARGYNKNEKVDVVIRPEHLDIVPRAEGMLKGTVKSQLFKGMHYETVVETRVGTSITVKMQVSQDRPVYNEEKGEKISANAFLLDVEDVEELDDAKVVALASAEAWDAETEEPISIKTVEYDIKPETGNYTVTFATANDTSITVKVLVVAQNRVESKVYQEEIYAMNFFKKVEDIQESIALDTDLETWASASAWSLEDGEQVEITDVKYDFDPETITPGVYDVTFSTEGYEYKVSTTHAFEEGEQVGLVFRPEDIHVMKKEGQW